MNVFQYGKAFSAPLTEAQRDVCVCVAVKIDSGSTHRQQEDAHDYEERVRDSIREWDMGRVFFYGVESIDGSLTGGGKGAHVCVCVWMIKAFVPPKMRGREDS